MCGGSNQYVKKQGKRSCSMGQIIFKNLRLLCNKIENLREAAKIAAEEEELSDDSDDEAYWEAQEERGKEQEGGVEPENHQVNQPTMSDLFGSDSDDDDDSDIDDSIQQDSDSDDDDSDNNKHNIADFVQPLSQDECDNMAAAFNHPVHIHKVPGDKGTGKLQLTHQNLTSLGDPEEMMQDVALEAAFRRLSHLRTNVAYIPESINWHTMLCKGERTLAMLCYDYCCYCAVCCD